ncbi:MAG: translesion DNA synthesis-associated protein ImuA [Burkholderiales bacterium]|nr:translesion DNA synthesis-associated protein ImuA [Burkholderiales bacterium]
MRSLEALLRRGDLWRGTASVGEVAHPAVPTGFAALDRELPGGGWPRGALVEILVPCEGIGELQLVLPALARASAAGGRIAWISPPHLPYAPALAAAGVALERLTVVGAPSRRDALWAAEQALRSRVCEAILLWLRRADYAELRRLAVAAEGGPAFALLFRAPQAAREPSPAPLRLLLEPAGGPLAVRVLKRRGAPARAPIVLTLKKPFHAVGGAAPAAARIAGARARACTA